MKAKDIKPGTVYAHQRHRHEYASLRAVVFLAPVDDDHLYSTTSSSPAFLKSGAGSKPRRGVGYPIATGPVAEIEKATLADFEAATSPYGESGVDFEVLTSLTSVVGLYEEVLAEQIKQLQDAEDAYEQERERERAHSARLDAQQKRLQKLGVGSTQSSVLTGPDMLAISADDMDKLLALLENTP